MKNKKYTVCCPVCGYPLFRSTVTNCDIKCFKCRADLQIRLMGGELKIRETIAEELKTAAQ